VIGRRLAVTAFALAVAGGVVAIGQGTERPGGGGQSVEFVVAVVWPVAGLRASATAVICPSAIGRNSVLAYCAE
jgi:hypothetical protein